MTGISDNSATFFHPIRGLLDHMQRGRKDCSIRHILQEVQTVQENILTNKQILKGSDNDV
jgi:hypothetical protein